MNANIIACIANVARINTLNANASIVKEDTSMKLNAKVNFAARIANIARASRLAAASLLALGALAASGQSAKADIVIDNFTAPQQTYSYDNNILVASAGETAVQLKLRNTDNDTVTGVTVQTYVYLASDVNNGWLVRAMPALTNQSFGPKQSKWVTIAIPQMSRQNFSLYNQTLWIKAIVNNQTAWLQNVLDRPADNVLAGIAQHSHGSSTFSITFTNHGTQNAPAKNVTVSATPSDANGPVVALNSVVPQTLSLSALAVGHSQTLTFTMPAQVNGAEFCALAIDISDPLIGYQVQSNGQVYY
jgi:hypothetical protein